MTRPEKTAIAAAIAGVLAMTSPAHSAPPSTAAEVVLNRLHAEDQAIERVGFRLATANAALCAHPAFDPGFSVHTLEQYGPAYRTAAAGLFSLGARPGVLAVAPGSPAGLAGLREGDALVAVDDAPFPVANDSPAHADFTRTARVQTQIQAAFGPASARVSIMRAGAAMTFVLRGAPACRSLFQVTPDAQMNGAADGDYVQVSDNLVALARDDDELAAALAHELAHNILGHRARLDAQHVSRGALAFFGRNARLIRASEAEADRLSVYLMARAGYDPDQAAPFLDRVSADYPLDFDPTHPSWRARIDALAHEAERISANGPGLPPDLAALLPVR